MKGIRQAAAIFAAIAMVMESGTMSMQNGRKELTTSAVSSDVTETMLTFENRGTYAAVTKCNVQAVNVEIPAEADGVPVTVIDEMAFAYCQNLETISIPEGVTEIMDFAFFGCESLESIVIPESVTELGFSILSGCLSLRSVTLPSGLTDLNDMVFMVCPELTEITLPEGLTDMGYGTFSDCTKLTAVIIPEGVTNIEYSAFRNSGLTSVTIPAGVTKIEKSAFSACPHLTDVYYSGTEEQWREIAIGEDNDGLLNAVIHFSGMSSETTETAPPETTTIMTDTSTTALPPQTASPETTSISPDTGHSETTTTTTTMTEVTTEVPPQTITETTATTDLPPHGDHLYGDADVSGTLDIVDVIVLNKNLMLGEPLSDQGAINADVDLNGSINATDSLNILKAVVNIVTLPVNS